MSVARRIRLAAALAIAVSMIVAGSAIAAFVPPTTVHMQVDIGYGGNYRPDAWVPVHVRLTNAGPSVTGDVTVVNSEQSSPALAYNKTLYSHGLVLPAGTTKELTIYVPGADLGQSVAVSFSSSSRSPAALRIAANQVPSATLFVGILSQGPAAIVQLKSLGGSFADSQVLATPLDARSMDPQPLALASLDAIVIENFATASLSSDQVGSLEAWVRSGGTLILIGGPTAQATLNGLPRALVPIRLGPQHILVAVPSLNAWGSSLPSGGVVAADGRLSDAVALLSAAQTQPADSPPSSVGEALVVQRPVGLGRSSIAPSIPHCSRYQAGVVCNSSGPCLPARRARRTPQ